jgi:RND family efflux transporter MFP subunit
MENSQDTPGIKPSTISSGSIKLLGILLVILLAIILAVGVVPRIQRERENAEQANVQATSVPVVNVVAAKQAKSITDLALPGNVQAITEAPILARAEGYVKKRYADIGDRVKAGQLLAEIDAPDLDQQVSQARASLEQAQAALIQAQANLEQAKANEALADVTKKRNDTLVDRGVLSKQEGDQSTANYRAQFAAVRAGEANIAASEQSVRAAKANLDRLLELQGYKSVRAPFAGVVTLRNIDTGTLINSGSTMLFRVAQFDVLRIFINVPQSVYSSLQVGSPADVSVEELAGRKFAGKITRLSGALDSSTRTLLMEVQVQNPDGALRPGMYATVRLSTARKHLPVIIPGDAVVTRANGITVAVVDSDNTAHFRPVQMGRDYGLDVEILSGLQAGESVVVNPTDDVREGVKVQPQTFHEGPAANPNTKKAPGGAS